MAPASGVMPSGAAGGAHAAADPREDGAWECLVLSEVHGHMLGTWLTSQVLAAGVTPHFTGKVGSFSLAVQTSHLLSELVKKAWSVAEFKPCTCEQRGCHTWSHRDAPSLHRLSSP